MNKQSEKAVRLKDEASATKSNGSRPRAFVGGCAAAMLVACLVTSAQISPTPPTSKLSFDVVSIKERVVGDRNFVVGISISPGRLVDQCANLESLVSFAYSLSAVPPVEGLPDWAKASPGGPDNYIVEATMPPGATREQASQMMQTLLAERFKLAFHWEKKMMPIYALVVANGGFKLKPYDPQKDPPLYGGQLAACVPEDPRCHWIALVPGPLSNFAKSLSGSVDRPVIDRTGVTGDYSIGFNWAGDTSVDSPLPSLPTVLRDKFGLELKADTGPVDVLVVDHAEKPTAN
jgi:uncharacterized protein (TIGR03435 family)